MDWKIKLFGFAVAAAVATSSAAQVVHYREGARLDPATIARHLGWGSPSAGVKMRGLRLLVDPPAAPALTSAGEGSGGGGYPTATTYAVLPVERVATTAGSMPPAAPTPSAQASPNAGAGDLSAPGPVAYATEPPPERASGFSLPVQFAFDSARLMPDAKAQLDVVADALKLLDGGRRVLIEGHTDAIGNPRYNVRLSRQRAYAVKAYLVVKHGIPERALVALGMGSTQPIDLANPAAAENRRVEFKTL